MAQYGPKQQGRGVNANPHNRFERLELVPDYSEWTEEDLERKAKTIFYKDSSRTFITYNKSPDIGYDASVNPYRGCEHGCVYCYARPNHEYLGFSAGLDFETKIMVKTDAPEILRKELSHKSWKPQVVGFSGVTDIYQPIERKLELTRRCLEVFAEFRNPVAMVTKNHLIVRDIDLIKDLANFDAVSVAITITTLNEDLRHVMEPRTSTAQRRLDAVADLAAAGIHVGVLTCPIIPGLTDHEIPQLVKASVEAGARFVGYNIVHLPFGLKELLEDWLEQHFPERKDKVLNRIKEMRGGKLNDPRFGYRMVGEGVYAEQIRQMHHLAKLRAGLKDSSFRLSTEHFRVPGRMVQGSLF
ncbi:MAG: PA0069 family radical SAM protein [Trueperaceae bacterium]|nr:PA0069 family radical SAM protein [Trueperaceae bacterium]